MASIGVNVAPYIGKIIPLIRTVIIAIIVLGISGAIVYYWLVVSKRRSWFVNIWEQKADGHIHLIGRDRLIARKFNAGKQTAYILDKRKAETIPPPKETVYRLGNKEYADYIRIMDDYIPLEKTVEIPNNDFVEDENRGIKRRGMVTRLKDTIATFKRLTTNEIENKYMYAPMVRDLVVKFDFKPIEYDVNMMRINEIDNIDKFYRDRGDWWQKYGIYVISAILALAVVGVIYMSFDYSKVVIQQVMSSVDRVASPLSTLVEKLTGTTVATPPG